MYIKNKAESAKSKACAYLQSTPNFLFGYIYKRKLNIKIKNMAKCKPES
jgi:hypothetical protein